MKKTLSLIIFLITVSILLFVVFTKANYSKITTDDALKIGEEKYLEFLWMVDGAFNNKLDGEFVVNGKVLNDDNKRFTCTYKNKKDNSCIGNNFVEEFRKVFASNITYNMVYGDGSFYTWIKYDNGNYIFNNIDSCKTSRMSLEQNLKIIKIEDNKIVFNVTSIEEHNKIKTRRFILILEDNDWKVSEAYYHDLCEMDYYIG